MTNGIEADELAPLLAQLQKTSPWQPPLFLDLSHDDARQELSNLLAGGSVVKVVDPVAAIADELYFLEPGVNFGDEPARGQYVEGVLAQGLNAGVWVYFPWNQTLARYPTKEQHLGLRTFRNRDLITDEEQAQLAALRVAVIGLSVGSNIAEQLVQLGIGQAYLLADHDDLSPTNLNRLRATMTSVGEAKTDLLAKKLSEADPFLDLKLQADGFTGRGPADLRDFAPDIVFDEVDDLPTKARLRVWAAEHKVPLLSVGDIGEKSIVYVERHDIETVKPFGGRLSAAVFERLVAGDIAPEEQQSLLIKVVGARHLSVRLLRSAPEIGKTLGGLPQLGSAASAGAALASVAVRELATTGNLQTGTYVLHPRRILGIGRQAGLSETVQTIRNVRAHLANPATT